MLENGQKCVTLTQMVEVISMEEKSCDKVRFQHPLDETHLDAVRGLIKLPGFHLSASTRGVRRSDAATSDKGKQICFMLMPGT